MIDKETVDRIFATADIVEVINDFVKLKRAGTNYKGLSPFSNEKTPSFFVSPGKQIFKCFSSGMGGNVVKFVMEVEKITYPEALKYLAKKYNIEIFEKELTPDDIKEKNARESMLEVSNYAQKTYSEWLWERDEGKAIGMSYFKERGFRENTITKFQLGYALEGREVFTKTALENGYKLEYLVKTGLTIDKNNYQFDRFSGRVLFPIHSLSGQILGFGGRILKKDDKTAKYLNSPESEIYHKSHILYGLYFAKQQITKQDKCYLVEGYTDVISLHQNGIENVVSSSGTALTVEQIRLVKRFTKNITVLYDGDAAGIKASLRGIDLILEEGMNVKVLLLPDGEDPDSYAQSHSTSDFLQFIEENESDFIRFKTKLLIKDAENDPVKRATLINDIVRSISVIPDSIVRSVYLRECSKLLEIEESVLYEQTYKLRRNKAEEKDRRYNRPAYQERKSDNKSKPQVALSLKNEYKHEHELIRALLNFGNRELLPGSEKPIIVSKYIVDEVNEDELIFQHPVYRKLFELVEDLVKKKMKIDTNYFVMHEDSEISSTTVDMMTEGYDDKMSEVWSKNDVKLETEEMKLKEIVPELILSFKNQKLMEMLKETQEEIIQQQASNNMEGMDLLIQKMQVLNELKRNISKKLGDRIIL